jgi:hypothetical protein
VALGFASSAHIMEGGRIRFSGPASELRDNPALLRSAYLLRGSRLGRLAVDHLSRTRRLRPACQPSGAASSRCAADRRCRRPPAGCGQGSLVSSCSAG